MPELPEVETVRLQLAPRLANRKVLEAGSFDHPKFNPARDVTGATFGVVKRRGKYLLISTLDGRELVVHLGMTGQLRFRDGNPNSDDPYLRAWWFLDGDETLEFADVRRFGRLRVVEAGNYGSIPTLAKAGPEPWDPALTPKVFHDLISQSKRSLKTQLLSQIPVAGVGNIYADEALWMAKINPKVKRLGLSRAADLLAAIQETLQQGLDNGGTTLRDYRNANGDEGSNQYELFCYGRSGQPCNRCNTVLTSDVIDARTTTWCPRCQRR